MRRFTNGANLFSTRSTWFSRAPARSRLHRAACGIWSLRSRSVSPARACACRLSLALSEVVVDVTLDDGFIDLVGEGFDLALRVGELKDSSLVVRRVAPVRFVLCASPDYVKQHGVPREPADLSNHRCLFYSLRAIPGEWRFKGPFPLQQRQYASCRDARGRRYRLRSDFCCGPESCGRSLDLANARLSTG